MGIEKGCLEGWNCNRGETVVRMYGEYVETLSQRCSGKEGILRILMPIHLNYLLLLPRTFAMILGGSSVFCLLLRPPKSRAMKCPADYFNPIILVK